MTWTKPDKIAAVLHPFKTLIERLHFHHARGGRNIIDPCPNCNHTVTVPQNGVIWMKQCIWCDCFLQHPSEGTIQAYENEDGSVGELIAEHTRTQTEATHSVPPGDSQHGC